MNYYTHLGKYFGYPSCCIKDFNSRLNASTINRDQELSHKGTGFIPCPSCAKKVVEGKITLEGLIRNRRCKTKFPDGSYY